MMKKKQPDLFKNKWEEVWKEKSRWASSREMQQTKVWRSTITYLFTSEPHFVVEKARGLV